MCMKYHSITTSHHSVMISFHHIQGMPWRIKKLTFSGSCNLRKATESDAVLGLHTSWVQLDSEGFNLVYIFLILHSIDFPRCLVCNMPVHPQVNLQIQTSKSFPTRTPSSFLSQGLPACFSYVANSGMNLWVLASYLNEELSLWLH